MFLERKDMNGYKTYTANKNDPYVIVIVDTARGYLSIRIGSYSVGGADTSKVEARSKTPWAATERQTIISHSADYYANRISQPR